jgi:hypothetical protein
MSGEDKPTAANPGELPKWFEPTCPGCKYDLRGTPDGACPECGRAFTLAGLIAKHNERYQGPPELSTAKLCLLFAWLVLLIGNCTGMLALDGRVSTYAVWFLILLVEVALTRAARGSTKRVRRWGALCVASQMAMWCVIVLGRRAYWIDLGLLFAATLCATYVRGGLGWRTLLVRAGWSTVLAMGAIGFTMIAAKRPMWYLRGTGPLTPGEELRYGWSALAASVIVGSVLASLHFHARWRRDQRGEAGASAQ